VKIKDIQNMKKEELQRNLADLRNILTKVRFDISGKQAKNHREARKAKKDIARILTVLKSPKAQ
jgi:ribosomal protein L29